MHKRAAFMFASLLTNSLVLAQSPLSISATLGGGLLSPQSSNLKGDIYSVYDFPLSKTSYTLSGKVRANIVALPFSIIGSVSYNSLFDEAVIPVTTMSGIVNAQYTQSLSLFTLGLGLEYPLLSTPIMKPYASLAGTLNFISGNAQHENNVIPESKLNSTNRLGLDLGLGTTFEAPFLPLALDLEIKYRLGNLLGKQFQNSGYSFSGFGGIPQTSTYNLNDSANPNDTRDHNRSINYLTVAVGITVTIL